MVERRRWIPRDGDGAETVHADGQSLRSSRWNILQRLGLEGLRGSAPDGKVKGLNLDLVRGVLLQVAQDVGDGLDRGR